jgi:hypothetical protein
MGELRPPIAEIVLLNDIAEFESDGMQAEDVYTIFLQHGTSTGVGSI